MAVSVSLRVSQLTEGVCGSPLTQRFSTRTRSARKKGRHLDSIPSPFFFRPLKFEFLCDVNVVICNGLPICCMVVEQQL